MVNVALLAVGANIAGLWGSPRATLTRVCRELEAAGVEIVRSSNVYRTAPVGGDWQPAYLNRVLMVRCELAPSALLRLLKRMERQAGRRPAARMSPRPLDLDIIDYGGRRIGRPALAGRAGLVLPHPEMYKRAFVLRPLIDVAPKWQHPVLLRGGKALLARLNPLVRKGVSLDSPVNSCDKRES